MGKPKHSDDTRGEQKGAQQHDEGLHGDKTRSALKAQINNDGRQLETRSQREANDPNRGGKQAGHEAEMHERMIADPTGANDGGHRLFENRTQHDEAERSSEKNRRVIDVERHEHEPDAFQIPGGHTSHPASPSHHSAKVKSTGDAGGNRSKHEHGGQEQP